MKIHQLFSVLGVLIFQSCTTPSFEQNIEVDQTQTGFEKALDSIVINKMNQYNITGLSIGIIQEDSILINKGFGVSDINSKSPITKNSIFHTASVSKIFTAIAIMELIEDNKISLNSKLVQILPELNYEDKRVENINIKHLLNHTSGLPDISNYNWDNNNQSANSLELYLIKLNLRLSSNPSTEYLYSNLGYDILGYIVEKTTRFSFEEFVKIKILNKAGMQTSDFRYFEIPDSLKTFPHSKYWISKNIYQRKTYPYTREHAPSSTLNASSKDLSNWMIWFLKETYGIHAKKIFSQMTEVSFEPYPYIGLGFQLGKINNHKTIGHFGGDKGFRSYLVMVPEKKIGLVLLANCDYNEEFRREILHPIAELMLKNGHE